MTLFPDQLSRFAAFMAANPSPTNCEAGKFYNVPCFSHSQTTTKYKNRGWQKWLPLIGPLHEDKEIINFSSYHIHVDTRFLSLARPVFTYNFDQALAWPLCLTGSKYYSNRYKSIQKNGILEVRRLKCRQSEPPQYPQLEFRQAMEDAHAHCRAADGLCPHRGIPLACGREIAPGVRQCPGHGLAWDSDGRMVRLA